MSKIVACVICSVLCGAAFAEGLPAAENGVITIDGEVTVSDSAGAAALAAATGLVLNEGATLTYAATDELNLTAAVSGTGTFKADGSGKVTLSGDNSGLVAPGHFDFKNTSVAVAHQHGLGSTGTGTAFFSSAEAQPVTFDDGTDAFVNDVALDFLITSGNALKLGSESEAKSFSQNADVRFRVSTGEHSLRFQNNFEMKSGLLDLGSNPRFWQDGRGEIWFREDSSVVAGDQWGQAICYANDVHIGSASFFCPGGLATDHSANITMERDYAFDERTSLRPYAQADAGATSLYYNLNGHSQRVAYLRFCNNPNFATVGSADPCVLQLVTEETGDQDAPFVFLGQVSLWHDCAKTSTLRAKSTSTGYLKVTKGTLVLDAAGGWSGSSVTVGGTGTLKCLGAGSFVGGTQSLTVEEGGTLVVGEGVELKVVDATFGSVKLSPQTTYSIADIQALVAGENVTVSGSGKIVTSAKSIPGEWTGWPEVGTATKVQIPDNSVATVADEDVEKVEALEEIETGTGVTIPIRTTTRKLTIKASISGGAVVSAVSAQPVVLLGDNSGIFSPGGFVFGETVCVVSNEYALGGTHTTPATFNCVNSFPEGQLVFGGENGVLTNRAAIRIVPSQTNPNVKFGAASEDEFLYQAADFTIDTPGGTTDFTFLNNVFFTAGKSKLGDTAYLRSNNRGLCGASDEAVCEWADNVIEYAENLRIGGKSFRATTAFAPGSAYNVTFTRDYCLGSNCVLRPYANITQTSTAYWFDFAGTTQEVSRIRQNAYSGSNYSRLHSAVPALVKTVGTAVGTEDLGIGFTGALSFWHDSADTVRFGVLKSTSTGDLSVSKGCIEFLEPTGWSGRNVTVKNGGSLVFSSSASLDGGTHVLTVEPGGSLTIAAGVTLKLQEATFGTVRLEPSTRYTVAEINALIEGEGVSLSGEGAVQMSAKSIPGEWTGWPEAGTATKVQVPDGVVAEVSAADVAKVQALETIELGIGSIVRVANVGTEEPVELTPSFVGSGRIWIIGTDGDVTNVIVKGDNSGLVSPGGFSFSNTWAVVANRHGLGAESTGTAEFYPAVPWTEHLNRLTFTGAATANDVALSFAMGSLSGYDTDEIEFVQRAGVKGGNSSYNSEVNRCGFLNRFAVLDGRFDAPYVRGATSRTVLRIEGDSVAVGVQGFYGSSATIFYGPKAVESATWQKAFEQSLSRCIFTRENVLNMNPGGYLFFYDGSASAFRLDLNGCSQTVSSFNGHQYATLDLVHPLTITSAVPATVTLNGTGSYGEAVQFLDQASLAYSGTATQTIGCATSTSTGSLTVNSGAIRLERDAKWMAGSVVLNGGELIVEPTASTNTFGVGRNSADLIVNEGGCLRLNATDGTMPTVRTLTVKGELLKKGVYTEADGVGIVGPGSLCVKKGPPEGALLILR